MMSRKFDPLSPLSHLNGYFTYTFITSVTKVSTPSLYLCDLINERSLNAPALEEIFQSIYYGRDLVFNFVNINKSSMYIR